MIKIGEFDYLDDKLGDDYISLKKLKEVIYDIDAIRSGNYELS